MPRAHITAGLGIRTDREETTRRGDFPATDDHGSIMKGGGGMEDTSNELFGYLCLQVYPTFNIFPETGLSFQDNEGPDFFAPQGGRGHYQFLEDLGFLCTVDAGEEWILPKGG